MSISTSEPNVQHSVFAAGADSCMARENLLQLTRLIRGHAENLTETKLYEGAKAHLFPAANRVGTF